MYTSNSGFAGEVKNNKFLVRSYELDYDYDKEIIAIGASEAVNLALRAIIRGMRSSSPSPLSYMPCAVLAGAEPIM